MQPDDPRQEACTSMELIKLINATENEESFMNLVLNCVLMRDLLNELIELIQ